MNRRLYYSILCLLLTRKSWNEKEIPQNSSIFLHSKMVINKLSMKKIWHFFRLSALTIFKKKKPNLKPYWLNYLSSYVLIKSAGSLCSSLLREIIYDNSQNTIRIQLNSVCAGSQTEERKRRPKKKTEIVQGIKLHSTIAFSFHTYPSFPHNAAVRSPPQNRTTWSPSNIFLLPLLIPAVFQPFSTALATCFFFSSVKLLVPQQNKNI